MKHLMRVILLPVLIFALTVPAAGADTPSRWCEQAPMALYQDLFTQAEHSGLNAPLTRAMAASILAGYEGADTDASSLSASGRFGLVCPGSCLGGQHRGHGAG